jgi:hypothetical protein
MARSDAPDDLDWEGTMLITKTRRLLWVLAPLILFAACGQSESRGSAKDEPGDDGALTAEYFLGPWCLRSVGLYGQGTEQNVPYVFQEDGSLEFQAGPEARVQTGGVWRVEGDRLYLEARPLLGALNVTDHSRDHFVIDFTAKYRFERGGCG